MSGIIYNVIVLGSRNLTAGTYIFENDVSHTSILKPVRQEVFQVALI